LQDGTHGSGWSGLDVLDGPDALLNPSFDGL
jgi:hypothetical protein